MGCSIPTYRLLGQPGPSRERTADSKRSAITDAVAAIGVDDLGIEALDTMETGLLDCCRNTSGNACPHMQGLGSETSSDSRAIFSLDPLEWGRVGGAGSTGGSARVASHRGLPLPRQRGLVHSRGRCRSGRRGQGPGVAHLSGRSPPVPVHDDGACGPCGCVHVLSDDLGALPMTVRPALQRPAELEFAVEDARSPCATAISPSAP